MMAETLWAVEAYDGKQWHLLPNLIFVSRDSAEWERDHMEPDNEWKQFALVSYSRNAGRSVKE